MKKIIKKTRRSKPKKVLRNIRFFTVGHSNRSAEEFLEVLNSQKLKLVVDVRKIPKSRRNPHFWGTRLARYLDRYDIDYIYIPELGGRRPPQKDSINNAWRNRSFQAYADHMQTEEFERGLKKLISLGRRKRLVIMCAEAVPWRCHRSLIADALLSKKLKVEDIFSATNTRPHKMTSFAKIKKGKVIYPRTL